MNVPVMSYGRTPDQITAFYKDAMRRIDELPGVERVAIGTQIPWREAGSFGPGFQFSIEGYSKADGEEDPRGRFRTVSTGFFASVGVPLIAGRDFNDADRKDAEPVVIVSESIARRMFDNREALNRRLMWTDPVMKFIDVSIAGRRIVGIVADVDDENVVPGPAMTVYHPFEQEIGGGRLFVHATSDPYALVAPITRIIREMSAEQPVENAATLEDVRAEVLAPNRLNALVFGGFAAVALTIAIVGVAGVLAFSVSARTREFGIRLAIGSAPMSLLTRVSRTAGDRRDRDRRRRGWRIRADPAGGRLHRGRARSWRVADRRGGDDSGRLRRARVAGAGGARVARGRDRRAAAGVRPMSEALDRVAADDGEQQQANGEQDRHEPPTPTLSQPRDDTQVDQQQAKQRPLHERRG